MSRYIISSIGCFVFSLMTCCFSGCECSKSCSGCSNECHRSYSDKNINKEVETNVNISSKNLEDGSKGSSIELHQKGKNMAKEKSASGLEWEVLQEGSGKNPVSGNTVTVHYTGWLNENGKAGKKFDSSLDRGQKFQFRIGVGMVIAGWDEGVMGMKIGEKRRLYIPSALGYGSHGAGAVIPPNADLIFDVELFDVN